MTQTALLDDYAHKLTQLKKQHNYRKLTNIHHQGIHIITNGRTLINLAGNDYLGLASHAHLYDYFLDYLATGKLDTSWQQAKQQHKQQSTRHLAMTSSSSRLLTGNSDVANLLEARLQRLFGKSALLFNSGYHANVGTLSALADAHTVILADKWVHASMIDGMRLSQAKYVRFAHQNFAQLEQLLAKYQADNHYRKIIVATESIFSMDGDVSNLMALVALKKAYPKTMLYVDEAHAVGVRGQQGLGVAHEQGVLSDIDIVVGAFGKAYASVGGFVLCHDIIRQYLINHARTFIFSTALPSWNVAWTDFMLACSEQMDKQRQHLHQLSDKLRHNIHKLHLNCPSHSHIVPIILYDNAHALSVAQQLQQAGFYALAVRPPTVPQGQARIRLCLHANLTDNHLEQLTQQLSHVKPNLPY